MIHQIQTYKFTDIISDRIVESIYYSIDRPVYRQCGLSIHFGIRKRTEDVVFDLIRHSIIRMTK